MLLSELQSGMFVLVAVAFLLAGPYLVKISRVFHLMSLVGGLGLALVITTQSHTLALIAEGAGYKDIALVSKYIIPLISLAVWVTFPLIIGEHIRQMNNERTHS